MAKDAELLDFFSPKESVDADALPDSSSLTSSITSRRSFKGIHDVISRINPQLLKSVLASGAAAAAPSEPVYAPVHRPSSGRESNKETAPLTIFYNGTVMVFDVPRCKAEDILKLAVSCGGSAPMDRPEGSGAIPSGAQREFLGALTGDLPMTRMVSLQRFLEKRKSGVPIQNGLVTKTPHGTTPLTEYWLGLSKHLTFIQLTYAFLTLFAE